MSEVTLRFYAELNDFLPRKRRYMDWPVKFQTPTPALHLIEACGVPHTEVELIVRDGISLADDAYIHDGDRLAVYPMFETFNVRSILQLRLQPLRRLSFVADAHLGRLAKNLRMLGFDTLWKNDPGDAALVRQSVEQRRVLLTCDRRLLMRRAVTHGCHIPAGSTQQQLRYLVQRLQLCGEISPFTLCMECNSPVARTEPVEVCNEIPLNVYRRMEQFWRCSRCRKVYWQGSHWKMMKQRIEKICPQATSNQN